MAGDSTALRFLMQAPVMMTAISLLTDQLEETYNVTSSRIAGWNLLRPENKIIRIFQNLNLVSHI